jgi:kynurenine formamidase
VPEVTEAEVIALFERCSNWGRWGDDDELGTLNLITPEKRLAALAGVRSGRCVSIGRDLVTRASRHMPPSAVHLMTYAGPAPTGAADALLLVPHGFEVTHMDALAHAYFDGRVYGGRAVADAVPVDGIAFGSIHAARDGILTRGVLLDVPAARGVEHLRPGDGISAADLEAAERLAGLRVEPGDAVVVRSGLDLREARVGFGPVEPREGLLPDSVLWLHERDVAVFSGDCIERLPSGYPRVPLPLHQVGLVAMGLMILDATDVELLQELCREEGRSEFLFAAAPLRLPGGSGSPVNPLVVF